MAVRDAKTIWLPRKVYKQLSVLKAKKEFRTFAALILDMLDHYNGDKE